MLTSERGPFKIFKKLREAFGIVHGPDEDIIAVPDGNMGYLLTCLWCLSMALALGYAILIYFFQDAMFWISLPLALSTLAIMIDAIARR